MCVEGLGMDDGVSVPRTDDAVAAAIETQHLQHPRRRVHKPHVVNPLTGMDGKLSCAIERCCRRREDFADPVRRELEGSHLREHRHAFTTPTAEIWNQSVARQMQLGLVENDPTSWPSPTPVERPVQLSSQARRSSRVPWRRPRAGDQFTVYDFGDEVLGNALQIAVGSAPSGGIGHDPSTLAGSRVRIEYDAVLFNHSGTYLAKDFAEPLQIRRARSKQVDVFCGPVRVS